MTRIWAGHMDRPSCVHLLCLQVARTAALSLVALLLAGMAVSEAGGEESVPHVDECNRCYRCIVDGAASPAQQSRQLLRQQHRSLQQQITADHRTQGAFEGGPGQQEHGLGEDGEDTEQRWLGDHAGGSVGAAAGQAAAGAGAAHQIHHLAQQQEQGRALHQLPHHGSGHRKAWDPGPLTLGSQEAAAAPPPPAKAPKGPPAWKRWPDFIPRILSAQGYPEKGSLGKLISPPADWAGSKAKLKNCTVCR